MNRYRYAVALLLAVAACATVSAQDTRRTPTPDDIHAQRIGLYLAAHGDEHPIGSTWLAPDGVSHITRIGPHTYSETLLCVEQITPVPPNLPSLSAPNSEKGRAGTGTYNTAPPTLAIPNYNIITETSNGVLEVQVVKHSRNKVEIVDYDHKSAEIAALKAQARALDARLRVIEAWGRKG